MAPHPAPRGDVGGGRGVVGEHGHDVADRDRPGAAGESLTLNTTTLNLANPVTGSTVTAKQLAEQLALVGLVKVN